MFKKVRLLVSLFLFMLILFACEKTDSTTRITSTTTNEISTTTTSISSTTTTTSVVTTTEEDIPQVILRQCDVLTSTLEDNELISDEIKTLVSQKLSTMTLAEKAGQMVQAERSSITPSEVKEYNVGSILSGGGSHPSINTAQSWLNMYNAYQEKALESSSGIPIIYGVDAVHGHNNVSGATIFPHNIGLGAANDPDLMYRIGETTAEEVAITGLDWNFSPAVSVVQDIRWGRSYESFGECPDLQTSLVEQYVNGLQQHQIAATAKHFIGDGGTTWNTANYRNSDWAFVNPSAYMSDQGNTEISMELLRKIHLPGYIEAINAGVDSVMISYSSFNGTKMHHHALIQTLLKDELGFEGIVVSDWEAIHQLSGSFSDQVIASVNSGIDMLMEPHQWKNTINAIIDGVNDGDISMARIDDAVSRILAIKYKNGLFNQPMKVFDGTNFNSLEHKELAREAARKSLVLLKNKNNALPLEKNTNILLLGPGADNVGLQNGGWTIEWQGTMDNQVSKGTSVLEGIREIVNENGGQVYTDFADRDKADVVLLVLAERPYAEGIGDNRTLLLNSPTSLAENITAINQARGTGLPTVAILLSGRPLIVTMDLENWDAFVAAWLPGSEGGSGIADVLFGDYNFTGKLPVTWPKYSYQIGENVNDEDYTIEDYLFPYGYGLEYE